LNSIESPYRIKSPTSQAQFKKPKFKTPNYNKKPKYKKGPNRIKAQFKKSKFKCQTTIKSTNTKKVQIELCKKPV
jgi:hypothetical protein